MVLLTTYVMYVFQLNCTDSKTNYALGRLLKYFKNFIFSRFGKYRLGSYIVLADQRYNEYCGPFHVLQVIQD